MMDVHKAVLGAVMLRPALAAEVFGQLRPEMFEQPLQQAFAALDGMWSAKGELDAVAAVARYPSLKPVLTSCLQMFEDECLRVTPERLREWVQLVKERYALQGFQVLALEAAAGNTTYDDLPGLYSRMGQALDLDGGQEDFYPIGELVDDYIRNRDQKPRYIPSGIRMLDKYLHIQPGNFILIGGRPSSGKTAFSLQIAVNMARSGFRVAYFSLETSANVLAARVFANHLQQPLADVRDKRVPPGELDPLADLRKLPLYIRPASGRGVGWIRAQAARIRAEVVFVDYVQILRPDRPADRFQAVTQISIALHELAQSTGMVVIGLAQLNRNAARAQPSAADLKESGQLEQDADAILLLDEEMDCCLMVKNKEGRVGRIEMFFDKTIQRFSEPPASGQAEMQSAERRRV